MQREDGGPAWIFRGDDWTACADTLAAADYPLEFALSTYLTTDAVEGACLAGFMPMSSRFTVPPGFPYGEPESSGQDEEIRVFYTPKLHSRRCVLDPVEARTTATTRRASKYYRVSVNTAFAQTLDACIEAHGDGWLTSPLAKVFTELHVERARRQVKFISIELWRDKTLAAGELGYAAGTAYASLSGFRTLSGAGTVQLAALAGILAESGFTSWDLGMPMEYKAALGCCPLFRHQYLPRLRDAYSQSPAHSLDQAREPVALCLPRACTRSGCG